jgi:putative glutamine amidotransferase
VLLTGGDYIDPGLYSAKPSAKVRKTLSAADPIRDLVEVSLIREVFQQCKPMLAICRGQQILNVAFGGSLVLDIPAELPAARDHCRMDLKDRVAHEVKLADDSLLSKIFGRMVLGVNSTHHQAVKAAVRPFRVTARSPDGVIEAMELDLAERHLLPYLLAVQFHPERLIQRHTEFLELFRSFARACASGTKRSI